MYCLFFQGFHIQNKYPLSNLTVLMSMLTPRMVRTRKIYLTKIAIRERPSLVKIHRLGHDDLTSLAADNQFYGHNPTGQSIRHEKIGVNGNRFFIPSVFEIQDNMFQFKYSQNLKHFLVRQHYTNFQYQYLVE